MDIAESITKAWALLSEAPQVMLSATFIVCASAWGAARLWYGSALNGKDAKIASLEERIKLRDDQLSGKFGKTPPEEALALIRQLEQRLDDLPRSGLTASQLAVLGQAWTLRDGTRYKISLIQNGVAGDPMYAQLLRLLRKTPGWDVSDGLTIGAQAPDCGLTLEMFDVVSPTPAERLIMSGMDEAGLTYAKSGGRTGDACDASILVSLRSE